MRSLAEGVSSVRSLRVPDELWDAATRQAAAEGQNISTLVRRLLMSYVGQQPDAAVTI